LRKLRLTIAREEGLPPYIIFNDKTLIDMSIKAPTDKKTILNVSGVGEAKYEKYGERFIDAIIAFMEDHPDAVTSIKEIDAAENIHRSSPDRIRYNRKMKRPDGAGASWTKEEDTQLDDEYGLGMKISEIAKVHDRTNGAIRARLKKHGLIE
ncbi:MAG: HRDC domain-containing protein, partial [Lachnospiraceae bacterium]|nr:HRDC domain-containing protein [Lachnospiraceae bacterium]